MNESVESERSRVRTAVRPQAQQQSPTPPRATLRPPRVSSNSRLPFWLVMLGLAMVLGAFSRGENEAGSTRRSDALAFDLDSLPATGSGGYTESRPSNQAFSVLHADAGRFYAPYGPAGGAAGASPAVAGVLVGRRTDAGGAVALADADAVYEFSLESGALRVTRQEGPFDPARFLRRGAARAVANAAPAAGRAAADSRLDGRYDGRLSDRDGALPAAVKVGADGDIVISAEDGCRLRGSVANRVASAVWNVEAVFGAGCTRVGEMLHGHAFAVPASNGDGLVVVLPEAGLEGGMVFAGHRR